MTLLQGLGIVSAKCRSLRDGETPLTLEVNVGENLGCGFRKAGDLPGLDRIDELFVQQSSRLMHILADRLDDGKRVEFFVVVPHEPQDGHPFLGQGALVAEPFPLGQGAGDLFVPVFEADQVSFFVHFNFHTTSIRKWAYSNSQEMSEALRLQCQYGKCVSLPYLR